MAEDSALDTRAQAEATPQKAQRRWMLELKLADKREKDWRELARKTIDTYRGKDRKKNSFNILWANTEVLRPALYNSPPKPDVRRRFRQNDLLGKAVAEVAERALSYSIDAYDMDDCLQADVIDALLPGRGLSRVRYVPKITTKPDRTPGAPTEAEEAAEPPSAAEAFEGEREEVEYEQALCEHVQWEDYRQGPGRRWDEVPWVAFRHRPTREDLIKQFGEKIGKKITLNDVSDEDLKDKGITDELKDVFKRAEVWEIWDKEGGKVFFVNESYREGLLYPVDQESQGEPPLKLKGFFPIPRPMQMVEDTGNLVPIPLYEFYKSQAEELDRLAGRINKIIDACRVRFVHDSTLSELSALMNAVDNEGIPTEQARVWLQNGGIEKAIWFMPIQQVAECLKELYVARDNAKQTIYEITGISDIIRGATNPNETLGAQQMKANSSSLRLQRMKMEVQRYARDLIRLLAEVIGENFEPQTLAQMTGLQFPTAQQKQMIALQMQAMQQQAQQPALPAPGGQPQPQQPPAPPPQLQAMQNALKMPSWEDIMGVLRNDMQREFRVDIETDSTVAQTLQEDMQGMKEVLTGVVEFWQGVGPAVQAGAVSMDAVKAITMSIVRRARMGLEVEDALESGMQQPKPQDNGEAAKAAAEQQRAQAENQAAMQKEAEITKREQIASQERVALDQQQKAADDAKHARETTEKYAFERWKVEQDNEAKIEVAEIAANATLDKQQIAAAEGDAPERAEPSGQNAPAAAPAKRPRRKGTLDRMAEMHAQALEAHGRTVDAVKGLAEVLALPQVPERGPDGRIARVVRMRQ